jgi:cytochrome P450
VPDGVARFDLSDPTFSVKSPAVHEARERHWYAHTNFGLVALRYDEFRSLLRDRRLRQGLYAWPQQNGITEGLLAEWWDDIIITKEGQDHRRLRKLVNPILSANAIEPMTPGFRRLAHEVIDQFAPRGECEFMADFATPFASRILLKVFAVPEDRWSEIARLADAIAPAFGVTIARDLAQIEAALAELYDFADQVIAERRADPGEDAVSRLLAAQEGSDRLTDRELQVLVVTFIFAGMDTTRNQIGLALHTFMSHPDQWDLLSAHPELGAAAVEEVMRVNPTVMWVTREATEDFTESANTDPLVGGDAEFDIVAERPKQMGFGSGAHVCIGHFLARADMREALPILAQRLRNVRPAGEATFRPESGVSGPIKLPIQFEPSPAASPRSS